ncbi:peptidoglycan DD-metalloendopeptidase family protein [Kovacikia minuta CCNUW1]|uniref:peptidoglycan DD-metalloendopeptidase family protein n=1 Tax=Kovacikia minuta TaxID=2931930 RepID=UPI001CCF675D|nr:peptidoglycan DD-metalloendopeptidase family protein [Kovacikia minuta]UBF24877.1 peptidoglycan DD-metalloendopeptidase family protein [Kovacikia minuta CCNUW1]
MLDILLTALPQQAAQSVAMPQAKEPAVEQVAPDRAPLSVVQPAISLPETIAPNVSAKPKPVLVQSAATNIPSAPSKQSARSATPLHPSPSLGTQGKKRVPISPTTEQVTETNPHNLPIATAETPEQAARRKELEAAKAERLKLLKQKLAELVESEKPLKQELLRQSLRNAAINYAKAGQLDRAREVAKDLVLSPFSQAEVLMQIDALTAKRDPSTVAKSIAAKSLPTPGATPLQGRAPSSPTYLLPNSIPSINPSFLGSNFRLVKPWKLPGGISLLFPLPFAVPMTSGFGWRIHPVTGEQRFHSGVDLVAPMGTPVVAAFSGRVEAADWMDGYGLTIILSPKNGKQEALYAHLSAVFVKPGQWVEQGTLIGQVGSTGLSTGPHLHFELRQLSDIGWEPIDPSIQLGVALGKMGTYVAIAQESATAVDSPPNFATIPPPPTQKFSILHNF